VTRKITKAVARISRGLQTELFLGNLEARRDWGYAPEYVLAMWKILQTDTPDDFVIGSGTDVSVKEFLEMTFQYVGLDWEKYVRFDTRYIRPTEVDTLVADASKAKQDLGWQALVGPGELAKIMVDHDLAMLDGFKIDKPKGNLW
jgi:GDPmannose 4,6-dehydratase